MVGNGEGEGRVDDDDDEDMMERGQEDGREN